MRNKISVMVLGLLVLVFVCGATGGCGGESFVDSTSYQYPNWTPEGLIYCQKAVTHYRKYWGAIGGEYSENRGTDYYYVTMSTEGTNETTLPYTSYPYFSPLGTYVALISGETISIVRRLNNVQTYSFSPTTESISELDWGPDEGKLVYLKNRGGINVINVDGTGDLNIAVSGEAITWKYGGKVVFNYSDDLYTYTAVINHDGTIRQNIIRENRVVDPQISRVVSNEVFGTQGWAFGYIDINLGSPQYIQLISDFRGYKPRLSLGANKITYGKFGETGIWLSNIDGSNLIQLK